MSLQGEPFVPYRHFKIDALAVHVGSLTNHRKVGFAPRRGCLYSSDYPFNYVSFVSFDGFVGLNRPQE